MEPTLSLVSLETSTTPLDGLHYRAAAPSRGAVMLLHGNMMNFYVGPPRFLPPRLVADGWDCLAFNRRGHDILSTRDSRVPEGGAFQTAAEAVEDNAAAASYLRDQGHGAPVLVGHSNGGLLAAQFAAAHPGTPALVLLSAHCGGRGLVSRASGLGLLAGTRAAADRVLRRAAELEAEGRGDELLLLPGWWYAISATSLLDREHRTPALLDVAEGIACPTLVVTGADEPEDLYPAGALRAVLGARCELARVDADHFYRGREEEVADLVADWLLSLAPGSAAPGDPVTR